MTVSHRPHVGWEVVCDARRCNATTATSAPRAARRKAVQAVETARQLSWLETEIAGQRYWACPAHQAWDGRLGRWVVVTTMLDVA